MVRFTFLPCHTFRHAYEFFVRFPVISRRQLMVLVALTLMWGVNWPMMKLSLQQISPLYFRASTMLLGAIWLFVYVALRGERMRPVGREWLSIAVLGLPNVLGWHIMSIFGVQELASGRAAILGFTMPIFTVLIGAVFFGERRRRLDAGRRNCVGARHAVVSACTSHSLAVGGYGLDAAAWQLRSLGTRAFPRATPAAKRVLPRDVGQLGLWCIH
jgi:uncharacterized membrane protein